MWGQKHKHSLEMYTRNSQTRSELQFHGWNVDDVVKLLDKEMAQFVCTVMVEMFLNVYIK